jgi:hypothetical protein
VLPNYERRSFVAHDADGDRYLIVAARQVGRFPAADQPGVWSYRTLDGRSVRPAASYHLYTVEPDDIRLTTTDPDEPKD